MATTKSTDLIVKDILVDAIRSQYSGMIVLQNSRAVVKNTSLPRTTAEGGKVQGGTRISVPYFDNLGDMDDVPEGDALTPRRLTMTEETASVEHSGIAVEITSWAQFAAMYADPYAEFARQFVQAAAKKFEQKLIAASGSGLDAAYINDVSGATAASAKLLDWDVMVDSKLKWGDEQGNIELMSVHSKVYGDLLKLKDSTGRPLLTDPNNSELTKFCGVPLVVSDLNTKVPAAGAVPAKYKTRIFKRSSMALWIQEEPSMKTDEDILSDSDIAAMHTYYVAYRYLRSPGSSKSGVVEIVTN